MKFLHSKRSEYCLAYGEGQEMWAGAALTLGSKKGAKI